MTSVLFSLDGDMLRRFLALGLVLVGESCEIFCGLGCPLSAGLSQVALLWCRLVA